MINVGTTVAYWDRPNVPIGTVVRLTEDGVEGYAVLDTCIEVCCGHVVKWKENAMMPSKVIGRIGHSENLIVSNERKEPAMASTRCKFRCNSIIPQGAEGGPPVVVQLSAVMSDDPESENGKFWTATPSGQTTLWINNPAGAAVFEQGKDYYVDFTDV